MSPSASPRCLAHRKHMASCATCVGHLLAGQRATTPAATTLPAAA